MLIAAGKMSGKRLVHALKAELDANGVSAVAVMSEIGVVKVRNALQRLANQTGQRISTLPTEDVVDGRNVMVVVITLETADSLIDGSDNVG